MKLTKKIALGLCLALVFTLLFSLSVFAEDKGIAEYDAPNIDGSSGIIGVTEQGGNDFYIENAAPEEDSSSYTEEISPEKDIAGNTDKESVPEDVGVKEEWENSDGEPSGDNVFSILFDALNSNAHNIFSALAFIGSLIIAIAYKKGLFPFVERSLNALSGALSGLREEVKINEAAKDKLALAIDERLLRTEDLIDSFKDKLELLESELGSMKNERCEREQMKLIMRTEVDMLFEIISASSIPQYQKDRANECFSKMKEKLRAGDADDSAP